MRRIWAIVALGVLTLGLLVGCSGEDQPSYTLTLPADTPPETVQLIRETLPAIEKHCPGLLEYSSNLEFLGVKPHAQWHGAADWHAVTWLQFKVGSLKDLPPQLRGCQQHHISIGIKDDGSMLFVPKRTGEAVFMDKPLQEATGDVEIKI